MKIRMATWPPPYTGLCLDIDGEDYIVEAIEQDPDAVIKADDIARQVAWDLGRDSYEAMPLLAHRQTLLATVRPATDDEVKAWADNEASDFLESRRIQRGQSLWKKLASR